MVWYIRLYSCILMFVTFSSFSTEHLTKRCVLFHLCVRTFYVVEFCGSVMFVFIEVCKFVLMCKEVSMKCV